MTATAGSRRTTTYILMQVLAATLYCVGAVAMKRSEGLTRFWPSLWLFLFFCLGAMFHAIAMKHAEMGVTYIVVLGLEAVLSFGLSVAIFGEAVYAAKVIGIALIASGIYLLNR